MSATIALHFRDSVTFLEYVLHNHAAPSTVVICSSREAFLEDVLLSTQEYADQAMVERIGEVDQQPLHPLMVPTIHLLATSRTIDLAFTPTLPHLRAYLASRTLDIGEDFEPSVGRMPGTQAPTLAVFGFTDLHRPTSEFSAQGLSRTLSTAVEVSLALRRKLIIADVPPTINDQDPMALNEHENDGILDPWMEQVPILNNSIRSGNDQRIWAGRTIPIARVIGRWCRIVRPDEESSR